MKLSDFTDKNTDFRPKKPQILAINNEVKEAQMASQIAFLEQKMVSLEQIADEKEQKSGRLEIQEGEVTRLVQEKSNLELKMSTLEGQLHEKERFLTDLESLKSQNDTLLLTQGEMSASMGVLRHDYDESSKELEQLRVNNAGLENLRSSLENTMLTKDTLIRELTTAITDVKYQYEGLISSTDQLTKSYSELADRNQALDKTNLELVSKVASVEQHQQSSEQKHKKDKEEHGKALEKRFTGALNQQITELQQDVDDLVKINKYYKTELSKPQQASVGAIARQENFKIPLASNAINYRTNNLGTAQPTLLKFSSREAVNDN